MQRKCLKEKPRASKRCLCYAVSQRGVHTLLLFLASLPDYRSGVPDNTAASYIYNYERKRRWEKHKSGTLHLNPKTKPPETFGRKQHNDNIYSMLINLVLAFKFDV